MVDRLIDEPRLKPLVDAVTNVVHSDGINEKFVLPGETVDTVEEDAVLEIASDISAFDDWYFAVVEDDGYLDPRKEQFNNLPEGAAVSNDNALAKIVRDVVEFNLEQLREVDDLPVEPDVDTVVNQLVNYIVRWQDWYYPYKEEQDKIDWYYNQGLNEDVYAETDYGNPDTSQGTGSLYYDEDEPPV